MPGVAQAEVGLADRKGHGGDRRPDRHAAAVGRGRRGGRLSGAGRSDCPKVAQISMPQAAAQACRFCQSRVRLLLLAEPRKNRRRQLSSADERMLLEVDGMNCASCVSRVETSLARRAGRVQCAGQSGHQSGGGRLRSRRASRADLVAAVERAGYHAVEHDDDAAQPTMAECGERELARWRQRLVVGLVLLVPLLGASLFRPSSGGLVVVATGLATALQFYVGWPFLGRRVAAGPARQHQHGHAGHDRHLAAYGAGVCGGRLARAVAGHGMYLMDAGIILTFITLGKYLEARAKGRARQRHSQAARPGAARGERRARGTNRNGRRGGSGGRRNDRRAAGRKECRSMRVVLTGKSSVDESWLTGESLPVEKAPGDEILAGTINGRAR